MKKSGHNKSHFLGALLGNDLVGRYYEARKICPISCVLKDDTAG